MRRLLTAFTLAAGAGAMASQARAEIGVGDLLGFDPAWRLKSIRSEHFEVNFPEDLEPIAQDATFLLEEAHDKLAPVLQWEPPFRVPVFLIDNADAANGLTSPYARLGIVLIVTPPDNWFSTGYSSNDWLRVLVFHEYTHFLNTDATRGFWQGLRYLAGHAFFPNSYWAGWMLEGLAVYEETLHTTHGRGRSPYYEMVIRAAVEAGTLDEPGGLSLDRITGRNPFYPGGETEYLFGYEILNRLTPGKDASPVWGDLSTRSSDSFPFLIHSYLQDVSPAHQDWYALWEDFVAEARARARKQLEEIRREPLTPVRDLMRDGFETLGSAASPDGRWLAVTADSLDRRMGLHLLDRKTGEIRRLGDKNLGAGLSFTGDSRFLILSSLTRSGNDYLYSDLYAYSLESGRWTRLSEKLRARDPSLSPDGGSVVFTLTEAGRTGLARARLEPDGEGFRLGPIERLWMPALYGRVSTPRYSRDGKRIVLSVHEKEAGVERIAEWDLTARALRILSAAGGGDDRFPVFSPEGRLYFVSDRTRVNNLYRLRDDGTAERVTNVTTGLAFPEFAPDGTLYASHAGANGWNLAEVKLEAALGLSTGRPPELLPAPTAVPPSGPRTAAYPVRDYSIFPSIRPRVWFPSFSVDSRGMLFGAGVLGFDAADNDRYLILADYDTSVNQAGFFGLIQRRMALGTTAALSYQVETTSKGFAADDTLVFFTRKRSYRAALSYPCGFTYSALIPEIAYSADREKELVPGAGPDTIAATSPWSPSLDATLSYQAFDSSRLAFTDEGGASAFGGVRRNFDPQRPNWKLLLSGAKNFKLAEHSVLTPSVKAAWGVASSSVHVEGRRSRIVNGFPSDDFDQITLRGYPARRFQAKLAEVFSLDFRFPLARVFRGPGTFPLFFEQLHGLAFLETAQFPLGEPGFSTLPSGGFGAGFTSQLFYQLPVSASVQYHRGFRRSAGGSGEVFIETGLSLPF